MPQGSPFFVVTPVAGLAGYLLAGGPGLIVVGFVAFAWKIAPTRRTVPWECAQSWRSAADIERHANEAMPRTPHPVRHVLQVLLSVAVIGLGVAWLETPGLLG